MPLRELIADALDVGPASKAVAKIFDQLITLGQNEFRILLDVDSDTFKDVVDPRVLEALVPRIYTLLPVMTGFWHCVCVY